MLFLLATEIEETKQTDKDILTFCDGYGHLLFLLLRSAYFEN